MFAQTRDVDLQIAEAPPAFLIGGVNFGEVDGGQCKRLLNSGFRLE